MIFKRKSHWQKKQELAAPSRYYGDGGTIHHSGTIDIQMHEGKVVRVWFRCQNLAFNVSEVNDDKVIQGPELTGVEVIDTRT